MGAFWLRFLGFWVLSLGFGVLGFGCRVWGFGLWVLGLGLRKHLRLFYMLFDDGYRFLSAATMQKPKNSIAEISSHHCDTSELLSFDSAPL